MRKSVEYPIIVNDNINIRKRKLIFRIYYNIGFGGLTMNRNFYTICIVVFGITGIALYYTQNSSHVSKATPTVFTKENPSSQTTGTTPNVSTASVKTAKNCVCCSEKRKRVREFMKQREKELEFWAREIIVAHGYEEGMKRVKTKSPALAQRVRQLLEREKGTQTTVTTQTIP